MKWEQGTLSHAIVRAQKTGSCQIFYRDHIVNIHFQEGQKITFDAELGIIHDTALRC